MYEESTGSISTLYLGLVEEFGILRKAFTLKTQAHVHNIRYLMRN